MQPQGQCEKRPEQAHWRHGARWLSAHEVSEDAEDAGRERALQHDAAMGENAEVSLEESAYAAGALNSGYAYREEIGAGATGLTVLGYLSARYTHSSAEVWGERLSRGEVRLAGAIAEAGDALRAGQVLVWQRPPWSEPAVPLAWAVLYRDAHILAVAKPAGLPTAPAGGFLVHTLLACVRRVHPEATPAHRLGRGTSGLVLFGLTPLARKHLACAFREARVLKVYRALVCGAPPEDAFSVSAPIGPVPHPTLGTVHAHAPQGRAACTHVRVLRRGPEETLVEAEIETGRPHQIRIHLAVAGHPLLGDRLYAVGGVPDPRADALPGDLGYWLHAHRVELTHPATGRPLALFCLPPPRLRLAGE